MLAECPIHLRWVVECAIHTGMRKGEILTLKWSQIQDGQIYLQKTKTNEPRQIPINDDLAALFKEIREHQQFRSEYVFPLKHVKKGFKAALKRAGIEDFRFHDLRHTFASHLLMRGGALKDVQEILGHKTMTMTLRYAQRPLKNPLFCPITASGSDFNPQNTRCIPAVARSEVTALNLRVDSPAGLRDRPCGQPDGCPIPLLCGIALELEQN